MSGRKDKEKRRELKLLQGEGKNGDPEPEEIKKDPRDKLLLGVLSETIKRLPDDPAQRTEGARLLVEVTDHPHLANSDYLQAFTEQYKSLLRDMCKQLGYEGIYMADPEADRARRRLMPTDYRFELHLSSGAHLDILVFNENEETEVRWIFSYRFAHREDGKELFVPKALIDYRLVVSYSKGQLQDEISLSMNVIIPERLGKKYVAGLDISPGAKTYLTFIYKRDSPKLFLLRAVGKGAAEPVELPPSAQASLVKQTELPFVLADRLEREGQYRVPFHSEGDDIGHFYFPESVKR
jgi:hypothetical protein